MKIRGFAALFALVSLVAGCSGGGSAEADRQVHANALAELTAPRNVVYEVEGDGTYFDMTAQTPTGSTQASPDLPLQRKGGGNLIYKFSPGDFVYLSAQIQNGRTITCRITSDNVVVSENTASGEYAIATCKGRA